MNKCDFFSQPISHFLLPSPLSFDPPEALPIEPQEKIKTEPKSKIKAVAVFFEIVSLAILLFLAICFILKKIKNSKSDKLLYELQQLKWRGLIPAIVADNFILVRDDPKLLKTNVELFLKSLPEKKLKGLNKTKFFKVLEKRPYMALKKMKEHLQIISFCKLKKNISQQDLNKSSKKIQKIFESIQSYKKDNLNEKLQKKLYHKIQKERSSLIIKEWVQKEILGEQINDEEAKDFLSLTNSKKTLSALKKFISKKMNEFDPNDPKISFFFWKELWEQMIYVNESKAIAEIGKLFSVIYFYQNVLDRLSSLDREEKTCTFENKLLFFEAQFIKTAAVDLLYAPALDYNFRKLIGLIREKLKNLGDSINYQHEHLLCGCHFSLGDRIEKEIKVPENDLVPRQVVDISRSRLNLLANIKIEQNKFRSFKQSIKLQPEDMREPLKQKVKKWREKISSMQSQAESKKKSEEGNEFLNIKKKPTILGLTCNYGSGHNTACQAIAKMLGKKNIHFACADVSTDVLLPASTIHRIGKKLGCNWRKTDFFNYILKKQLFFLPRYTLAVEHFFKTIKDKFFRKKERFPEDNFEKILLRKRLLLERPDQIMAFYDMDLKPVLEVAEEMDIKVTYFATDLNSKMQTLFGKTPPKHSNFTVVTASNLSFSLKTAEPISRNQIRISSGAARPSFYLNTSQIEIQKMRAERNLSENDPAIMFMAGGNGCYIPFPEQLAFSKTWTKRIHLCLVLGTYTGFGERFKALVKKGRLKKHGYCFTGDNPFVTIELVKDPAAKNSHFPYLVGEEHLNKIYDLVEVIFSKPGGSTTVEARIKNKIMMFDHRKTLLPWEEDNLAEMVRSGFAVEHKIESCFEKDLDRALVRAKKQKDPLDQSLAMPFLVNSLINEVA